MPASSLFRLGLSVGSLFVLFSLQDLTEAQILAHSFVPGCLGSLDTVHLHSPFPAAPRTTLLSGLGTGGTPVTSGLQEVLQKWPQGKDF